MSPPENVNRAEQLNLEGHTVLVTRPLKQARQFIERLEQSGGNGLLFPVIEIRPLVDATQQQALDSLDQYDMILFISANAVQHFLPILDSLSLDKHDLKPEIAAIGKASALALKAAGISVSIVPEQGYDSEALLAHSAFQAAKIEQRRLLLVKGQGGRELITQTLQQRGAQVDEMPLYQRIKPLQDMGVNRQQLSQNWHTLGVSCITVTSIESLQNLYDMLDNPGRTELLKTALVVPSLRVNERAIALGFEQVNIAESAHDSDMLRAVDRCGK